MEQTEHPDEQRQMWIEHIFRASDQVLPSCDKRSRQIDSVEGLKQQQPASGPGKNDRAFQPQPYADQHVPDIAEEQEILRAILMPVQRSPH